MKLTKPSWLEIVRYQRTHVVSKAVPLSLRVELGDWGWGLAFRQDWRNVEKAQSRCQSCRKPYVDGKLNPQLPHAIQGICCECASKSFDCSWQECVPWVDLGLFAEATLRKAGLSALADEVGCGLDMCAEDDNEDYVAQALHSVLPRLRRINGQQPALLADTVGKALANRASHA